jgi:tetrapyrrole methylase family protein / MazG family protein
MTGPARPRVEVVGLGPGGADLLHAGALAVFAGHAPQARFTRTDRHPAVVALGEHGSFDDAYAGAERLDDVYTAIAAAVATAAAEHGSVCYAVPGSPLVAERTVELLRARPDLDVRLHPALSFLDLAWARLGVDPLAAGVRLVDGHRFAEEAAGQAGPLLIGQCDHRDVLSAVKLAVEDPGDLTVTVLQRLGLPDESVREIRWEDLDREVDADHLTSLWIPRLAAPVAAELVRFAELVRVLRERCPWDSVQTHTSLRPYVVEEAYEVVDAIDGFDPDEGTGVDELEEELGDLLFQVVLHAAIAAEEGWFTLADVARVVHDKLVRRHPHVFGDVTVDGADDVVRNWDEIKAAEKGRTGPFDGIPAAFPARLYAEKVQRRAAKAGLPADLAAELAALERAESALRAAAERIVRGGGDAGR